jgi:hypothetical protein
MTYSRAYLPFAQRCARSRHPRLALVLVLVFALLAQFALVPMAQALPCTMEMEG